MLLETIFLLPIALFLFNWWAHGYWKRKNVFSLPTEFLFGNSREVIMRKKQITIMFSDIYKKYKQHKMIGFYFLYKPMLLVSDPEIIKRVLATDFNSFHGNGFTIYKDVDPLMGYSPFTVKDIVLWKELRSVQVANQASLRLKELVPNLGKIVEYMCDYIKTKETQPILVLDITTRAAIDSAVLHGFGIEPKSFIDPEFSFMKHASGETLLGSNFVSMISGVFLPSLNKLLNFRLTTKEAEEFFLSVIKTSVDHRQSSKTTRGDLVDTIMRFNKKKLEQGNKAYSDLEMAAHLTTFYMDGTATTSVVLSFLLLELANHQDVQEKLRKEIFVVGREREDLDYEKINSITYLQMVLEETLRLHPPVAVMSRICTKDVIINNVKISKGTRVFISPTGLHYDPEYFPDPEKFDPERFSEINKESLTKYTFLPFGEGPRICVGMKYGIQFVKTSISFMLQKYRILPANDQNTSLNYFEHTFLFPRPDAAVKFEEL